MINRPFWTERLTAAWKQASIVWLTGPRRVGKTVLAQSVPDAEFLNCDLPSVAERLRDAESFFRSVNKPLRHYERRLLQIAPLRFRTVKAKPLLCVAVVLSLGAVLISRAQDSSEERGDAKSKILAYRIKILGASREPYRRAGGRTYDLNVLFAYEKRLVDDPEFASSPLHPKDVENWSLTFGRVQQILGDDGILLRKYEDPQFEGDSRIVRLKNFPREGNLVDGQKMCCFAFFDGRYSYVNTSGARATVESYDYGTTPSETEMSELQKRRNEKIKEAQERLEAEKANLRTGKKKRQEESKIKTFEFYQAKAKAGEGYAQFRLGQMYSAGDGVQTNIEQAKFWLNCARTNGQPDAERLLRQVEFGARAR